jgi:predicted transcriptional regulator
MRTAHPGKITTEGDGSPPPSHQPEPPVDVPTSPDHASPPDRITVSLIPRARRELQQLHDKTSLSKTDIVNRAIALYEFIEAQLSAGRAILIRDRETGEVQRITLI